jgi:transcriptional regulator GlxA family with amidase domain
MYPFSVPFWTLDGTDWGQDETCRLVDGPEPVESRLLDRAFRVMDHRMAEFIGAAEIADELGISTGQLARIFRASGHLLVETTLSVKQIASEVGIHDLQYFNKQIRGAFGASPTQVRRGLIPGLTER